MSSSFSIALPMRHPLGFLGPKVKQYGRPFTGLKESSVTTYDDE
jgi:hypothetical protein